MSQSVEAVIGRWSDGPGPLHRKLSDALRNAVKRGHLPAGERLPSERDLALRLAVSRSTVVTAYDTLRGEGVVESRQGSGTRVCSTPTASDPHVQMPVSPIYRSLIDDPGDVISLACAVFPAHPLVQEAMESVVADDVDKLLSTTGYLPAGLPALREALARMLTDEGTPTTPEQVLVTGGAQQAINLATALLVRPGDDVIVEAPSFSGTLDIFRARGARLVPVPIDDQGVDPRHVAAAVAAHRPAMVYLMPTFHNPTGTLLAPHRRRALAELSAAEGLPIVEDNALQGAPLDVDLPPPVAAYAPDAPVITAGSFSKVAWGGLRVGWLRGPAGAIARLSEIKAMTDLGSSLLDQAIAARLVPHLPQMYADHRALLRRNLDHVGELLREALPTWRWSEPTGGPSLWIHLPTGNASAFAQVALRYGVEVIPGDVMSPTGEDGDHIRFPYTAEPPVLEETVRRLAQAWRAYVPVEAPSDVPRRVVV